jgi:hypothetical protein
LSRFVISDFAWYDHVWRLLLTLWVGSTWALSFIVLPGLSGTGLAPLLVNDVSALLVSKLLTMVLLCTLVQSAMLIRRRGTAMLFLERSGRLLLVVMLLALAVLQFCPPLPYWRLLACLLLAFLGLLLVLQPQPAWRTTA